MARTTPKPSTSRIRYLPARRLAAGSTAPSARFNSKPKSAPIPVAVPTVSWSAGRSSTTPASVSIRLATCRATNPRGPRWATWLRACNAIRSLNPCSPTVSANSASAAISARAVGWATNSPSHTVSILAEAAALDSEPADLPPPLHHRAMPCRTLLHASECLSCLVPAAVRNSQQEAAQPCDNQTVSSV